MKAKWIVHSITIPHKSKQDYDTVTMKEAKVKNRGMYHANSKCAKIRKA